MYVCGMKIKSNKTKRTYTIIIDGLKYRTLTLSAAEFQELEYNTASDWINYVKQGNCIAL